MTRATTALRKAMALPWYSSFLIWLKALREASSMQMWPTPRWLLWPLLRL
jgi:hypothetical protein